MNLCKQAKVAPFGLHAIRRLSASILDDIGQPMTVIQTLLRRKSATTNARYLHKLRGMRTSVDGAFTGKVRPEAQKEKRPFTFGEAEGRPVLRVIKFR